MTPKFSDYLTEQVRRYMFVVVIGTSLIFLLLTVSMTKVYNDFQIKKDAQEIKSILVSDYMLIKEMILDIEDSSDIDAHELLTSKLYKTRSNATVKFNFTMFDKDLEVIATNLYPQNEEYLLDSDSFKSALRQLNVLDDFMVVEDAVVGYSKSQNSMMTVVINTENFIYVIEPLYSSFLNLEQMINSHLVITDQYDNVMFDTSFSFSDSLSKFKFDHRSFSRFSDNICNLYYIHIIKAKSLTSSVIGYMLLAVITTLMVLLNLLKPLNRRLTNSLDEPLNKFLKAIEVNKDGNLDYYLDSTEFQEFDLLYFEFNQLMKNTKNLMKSNEELLERKKEIEIKHLKNQFNPHFLYNSLESIRYEIMFNPKNASFMLLSLGRLMQYSIENEEDFVYLYEDIAYLEDYLRLQKMRYKNRLDYDINIDQEVEEIKIPKLIIQPLIENSIKHNMEKVEKLSIEIKSKIIDEDVYFIVKDDGIGIDEVELDNIMKMIKSEENRGESIGLYNIDRTVKLIFGEEYGINLKNFGGLEVTLKIPKKSDIDV